MNSHEEEIKILNRTIGKLSRQVKILDERYRAITETVVDAIISIDEGDRIIFCNPATKKIFGYEDEIIGSNITTLMPERYQKRPQERYEAIPEHRYTQDYREYCGSSGHEKGWY